MTWTWSFLIEFLTTFQMMLLLHKCCGESSSREMQGTFYWSHKSIKVANTWSFIEIIFWKKNFAAAGIWHIIQKECETFATLVILRMNWGSKLLARSSVRNGKYMNSLAPKSLPPISQGSLFHTSKQTNMAGWNDIPIFNDGNTSTQSGAPIFPLLLLMVQKSG